MMAYRVPSFFCQWLLIPSLVHMPPLGCVSRITELHLSWTRESAFLRRVTFFTVFRGLMCCLVFFYEAAKGCGKEFANWGTILAQGVIQGYRLALDSECLFAWYCVGMGKRTRAAKSVTRIWCHFSFPDLLTRIRPTWSKMAQWK